MTSQISSKKRLWDICLHISRETNCVGGSNDGQTFRTEKKQHKEPRENGMQRIKGGRNRGEEKKRLDFEAVETKYFLTRNNHEGHGNKAKHNYGTYKPT